MATDKAPPKGGPTPPTLEQLLHDPRTHPFMLEALQKSKADALLMFWADCEQFKQHIGKTSDIGTQAKKIVDIHFGTNSRTCDLLGPVERDRVLDQFRKGKPTLDMFSTAQRECVKLLRSSHYPAFLESKSYKEMQQANIDMKNWTLLEAFRDPKRVRALNLLLLVERPEFVETLRFALDLRNRYKPLLAEGMLPDPPSTGANKGTSQRNSQKLSVVKELIDLGKFLEKKYLSADSKQFAKGVSGPTAARVRNSLEECSNRLDSATQAANQHISITAANQASAATRWVRAGALGQAAGSNAAPTTAAPVGPSAVVLEDTVKLLADAFKQAEEEAVAWLERYAMADAKRTDFFLTPIVEPPSPNRAMYFEDAPVQDSILVLRLSENEMAWPLSGPHCLKDRQADTLKQLRVRPLTNLVVMETVFVNTRNSQEVISMATDVTGATVSGSSRGLKFRTKVSSHFLFGEDGDLTVPSGKAKPLPGSLIEGEDSVIQQAASRVTSLAGVSQQEAVAESAARAKSQTIPDPLTLMNTELHAHCFPMHLGVEVDPVTFANEGETTQVFSHNFCLPCKSSKHSFEKGCTCVYGVCLTRIVKKSILVPTSNKKIDMAKADTSILSNDSSPGGSFSLSKTRGKSPRQLHYSETALALQKVPNFGLGLNLALNRDGSVEVTRFVSDVSTPSPAAASGRIAVEDELLFVNRVSVHGRRFDDIVGQIKNASSPVYLRFARGNYLDAMIAKASTLSSEFADRLVQVRIQPLTKPSAKTDANETVPMESLAQSGENQESDETTTEEMIKFTVLVPEVVCVTSSQPIFTAMKDALEHTWVWPSSNMNPADEEKQDGTDLVQTEARRIFAHVQASPRLSWRMDVRECVFDYLDVPHVVDILSAILLERRIMIISDLPDRVAPAVLALLQMIRPFSWRHDMSPMLPEPHYDWFTSRIGVNKPFLVGLCTLDVVPNPIDQFIPRRQGRLTLREDVWSTRERDFLMPSERLVRNAGYVRNAVSLLTSPDTLIVDLDADRLSGNVQVAQKDRFPSDIRDQVITDINLALGRGGVARWNALEKDPAKVAERINAALITAFTTLTLHRCGEFAISLREGVIGFYRGAFLGGVQNDSHLDYLEKLTKTETFKDYVTSNWDVTQ